MNVKCTTTVTVMLHNSYVQILLLLLFFISYITMSTKILLLRASQLNLNFHSLNNKTNSWSWHAFSVCSIAIVHTFASPLRREFFSGSNFFFHSNFENLINSTYSIDPIQLHVSGFPYYLWQLNQLQMMNMLCFCNDMYLPLFALADDMYVNQLHCNDRCAHKRIQHDAIHSCQSNDNAFGKKQKQKMNKWKCRFQGRRIYIHYCHFNLMIIVMLIWWVSSTFARMNEMMMMMMMMLIYS